jgi:hypothetical protein
MNFDSFDERADNLSTRQPISSMKPFVHFRRERFYPSNNPLQLLLQTLLILYLLHMRFQLFDAFTHARDPGLKFGFVNDAFGITINQTRNALS